MKVTKAIIPVSGYGTRRLPVSKSLEKCMMPVLNRPIVDYVVRDILKAGIRDFYFVVQKNMSAQIRAFFGHDHPMEAYLSKHGKTEMLNMIQPPAGCTFHFIEQDVDAMYGTTPTVWLCREFIEPDEHVLVVMGDQFFFNEDGASEAKHFLEKAEATGTPSAMLAVEVPHKDVSRYGIVSTVAHEQYELYERIVEKPSIDEAPTNLNNASFYLFDYKFFDFLDAGMHKVGGVEYYITDVLNDYVSAGNKIAVIRSRGEYLDCGNVEGWLAANNRLAEVKK